MFRKFTWRHRFTLLCSNVVKFARRKICEIVRYLHDQKQNFGCLAICRYCADRTQNLSGPAFNNVLTVLQISSKSVQFRRSYSRPLAVEYFHDSPEAKHRNSGERMLKVTQCSKYVLYTALKNCRIF